MQVGHLTYNSPGCVAMGPLGELDERRERDIGELGGGGNKRHASNAPAKSNMRHRARHRARNDGPPNPTSADLEVYSAFHWM